MPFLLQGCVFGLLRRRLVSYPNKMTDSMLDHASTIKATTMVIGKLSKVK